MVVQGSKFITSHKLYYKTKNGVNIIDNDNNLQVDELLKFAMDNGMIDISYMQEQVEMKKREEILKRHPYNIWEDKNEYWNTYLPDGNKRRRIKKKDKNDLIDIVVMFWKSESHNSFKERYDIWIDRQIACGRSDNTIYKYKCDFKRFFLGDEICEKEITKINDEYICLFIQRLLKRKQITYRALKGMFGYMNGVFEKAIIDKVIENNPCKYVDLPTFKCQCEEEKGNITTKRILSTEEKNSLLRKLNTSYDCKPNYIVKYAVELAMYTGMRVGELSALRWEDIDFNKKEIIIRHSEKQSRLTKEYTVSTTKNCKVRVIPLTDEMQDVLFRAKEAEIKNGFLTEYVFSNENGRIHARVISNCARNTTMSKEFSNPKSIHAIRRTVNSDMRCNGVSPIVTAALLGHTVKVNSENYTYDVSDMSYKQSVVAQINKNIKCV